MASTTLISARFLPTARRPERALVSPGHFKNRSNSTTSTTRRRPGEERAGTVALAASEDESYLASTPKILFENEHLIVAHKPAGQSFHSEFEPGTLATLRQAEGSPKELYSVHRLDKPTSGALVFAKTKQAAAALSKAFENKEIVKYYIGLSSKKPKKKMGTVTGDMERSRRKSWKLTTSTNNPALTKFITLGANSRRMWIFRPLTGKTHQLRVASKSLGAALLGDEVYGGEDADRMYLHSIAVRIPSLWEGFGPPIQVICHPMGEGEEWDDETINKYFPADLVDDFGPWFDEQPLICSAGFTS